MKVAELYAQLGVKVDPADLSTLKEFEKTLNGIAAAARSAATALRRFARVTTGGMTTRAAPVAGAGVATAGGAMPPPPTLLSTVMAQAGAVNQQAAAQANTSQPSTSFVNAFGRVLGMTLLKTLGIVTLAAAVKKLTSSFLDMTKASMVGARNLDQFSRQTGMSRQAVQRYERIGAMAGIQAEDVQSLFQNLRQTFERIRETGEGAPILARLGIPMTQSPEEMLQKFMEATKRMDEAQAKYFAGLLGISDDFLYAMRKFGDTALPESLITSERGQKALADLNTDWNTLVDNFKRLGTVIISDLAPALSSLVKTVSDLTSLLGRGKYEPRFEKTAIASSFANPSAMAFMGRAASVQNWTVNNNVTATGPTDELSRIVEQATSKAVQRPASQAYFQSSGSFLPPLNYSATP